MDSTYFKEYYHLERNHWWFLARMEILEERIRAISNGDQLRILNVGVATGASSEMMQQFGEVVSVEYDEACCDFLINQLQMPVTHASLTDLPFPDKSFDLVCAFDVIEHIADHAKAAEEMQRVLRPNGNFVITVPAFMFLWSNHDVVNHHMRRYRLPEIRKLVEATGFIISRQTYFNFLLFTPIAFTRIAEKRFKKTPKNSSSSGSDAEKFENQGLANKIFYHVFRLEKYFFRMRLYMPFGISIYLEGTPGGKT